MTTSYDFFSFYKNILSFQLLKQISKLNYIKMADPFKDLCFQKHDLLSSRGIKFTNSKIKYAFVYIIRHTDVRRSA